MEAPLQANRQATSIETNSTMVISRVGRRPIFSATQPNRTAPIELADVAGGEDQADPGGGEAPFLHQCGIAKAMTSTV